jgi:HEPN domain-containing protein
MPLELFSPDDPLEWLRRARSSLLQAQAQQPGVYLEDLCFSAQQAAEKALKALLIYLCIHFPYIHDINRLMELIAQAGVDIPEQVLAAGSLSDYAVEARYPGTAEPVTQAEYLEAVNLARTVILWIESQLIR